MDFSESNTSRWREVSGGNDLDLIHFGRILEGGAEAENHETQPPFYTPTPF